jgi:hypothetical protein
MEEKLAGTRSEDAIRKSSQATLYYYQPTGRRDPRGLRRRWLNGFMFE